MKLTKISIRNFKGHTGSLDLAAINFLVGSNFIGKTTWADAIRLLLIGYLPELGKTNAATFGLASGREMVVEGTFDNGHGLQRKWAAKGDSVTAEIITEAEMKEFLKDGTLAVMLDAATYFEQSDRERVAYVFANCPVTHEPLITPAEVNEIIGHEFCNGFDDPREFVDAAIVKCAEGAKGAKSTADQMQKTAQGLAFLRTQDEPEKGLDALDRERAEVTAEIERQQAEKARHFAQYEAAQANRRRRQALQAEIRGKDALVARLEPLRAKLAAKEADLQACALTTQEEVDTLRERAREAQFALTDLDRQVREVTASILSNENDRAGVEAKTLCPYCGATGDGWKALKVGEIDSALSGLRVKFTQLTEHRALVKTDADQLANAATKALEALRARNAVLRDIANIKTECEQLDRQFTAIQMKEGELEHVPAENPEAQAAVETAQAALNVANESLRRIDAARKAVMGRASELKRLAEAETSRDKAKEEEAKAKAAVEALRAMQAKMVEAAFEPLLRTANSFFPEILRTPLAYNPDRGVIGTWRDGVWVGNKTFSGVEKLVCFAAIQAALAARSPFRIMILDEMLRAQNTHNLAAFDLVVAACKRAVAAGRIDQFVGLIPGNPEDYARLADSASQVVAIK